jgi:hypothetical protein
VRGELREGWHFGDINVTQVFPLGELVRGFKLYISKKKKNTHVLKCVFSEGKIICVHPIIERWRKCLPYFWLH